MKPHTQGSSRNLVRLSKFLALVLRHEPEAATTTLDQQGWADVNDLIQGCRSAGHMLDRATLERIVREDAKAGTPSARTGSVSEPTRGTAWLWISALPSYSRRRCSFTAPRLRCCPRFGGRG